MDGLGRKLIRSLVAEKTFKPLTEARIGPEDISDEARAAFYWIRDYVLDNLGDWPTAEMVEENIEDCSLDEVARPLKYEADLVRKRRLGLEITTGVKEAARAIDVRDPDKALRILTKTALELQGISTAVRVSSFVETGPTRLKEYDEAKARSGLLGIPTKWEKLNEAIQGWVNGTLNVVPAMQNTGKTWWACIDAENAMSLGYKALFVTLEMAEKRISRRFDAIRYKIPFGKLRNCELAAHDEIAWSKAVKDAAGAYGPSAPDIIIADKKIVRTVPDCVSLIQEYRPDIIYIDGGYRFEPSGQAFGGWADTKDIVNELQLSAEKTDIPWVVTTQLGDSSETGKEKKRKDGKRLRAWNVRYGKEWVINPDNVIGLYQDDELRRWNRMENHILKIRDAGDSAYDEFLIRWDREKMDFEGVDSLNDDDEEGTGLGHVVKF